MFLLFSCLLVEAFTLLWCPLVVEPLEMRPFTEGTVPPLLSEGFFFMSSVEGPPPEDSLCILAGLLLWLTGGVVGVDSDCSVAELPVGYTMFLTLLKYSWKVCTS